jgi:hypothetical protein
MVEKTMLLKALLWAAAIGLVAWLVIFFITLALNSSGALAGTLATVAGGSMSLGTLRRLMTS